MLDKNICYLYLTGCYHDPEPICLDWREICDEEYCEAFVSNECQENKYRCHNGIYLYDKIHYIQSQDCRIKYNPYLFYQTKPKDIHLNYAIHTEV